MSLLNCVRINNFSCVVVTFKSLHKTPVFSACEFLKYRFPKFLGGKLTFFFHVEDYELIV